MRWCQTIACGKALAGVRKPNPDLVDFDGTDLAAHAGDNSTFLGVALEGSESGDIHQISVATRCMVDVLLDASSAALVLGDGASRSSGSNGVNWDVTKNTVDGIMWAYENNIAASAKGIFLVDSHALGGGFLFDPLTEA